MKTLLELDKWNRKEHFLFFSQMQEPFFGVTLTIDCTIAYQKSKNSGVSFFVYYLHKTMLCVNQIEPFRYRIIDKQVYIFENINASATILRDGNTFGFSFIKFDSNFEVFLSNVTNEIARVKQTTGLFTHEFADPNVIHFSALPWINFTSFSHARSFSMPDSCPKISFGKMTSKNDNKTIPVSIHVHHGLMDGFHIGQFVALLQEMMDS